MTLLQKKKLYRESGYGRQVGTGPMRYFTVTFVEDSPDRADAVQFFTSAATLRQSSPLPREIDTMSDREAQAYLDENPRQKSWTLLNTASKLVADSKFSKLIHLPELERIYLYGVGNAAVGYLRGLNRLVDLVIYSSLVDDDCLHHLAELSSLRSLDLQASQNVTREGFLEMVKDLPRLKNWYPPRREVR